MNSTIGRRPTLAGEGGVLGRFLRCVRGVSAVEFAVVSPMLVLGTFGMVDAGAAVYQRMMISQVLRAGAESVLRGADESVVREVLEQTASENFTVASGDSVGDTLALGVETSCACPADATVSVGCTDTCASGTPAFRFYRLTANKKFQGILLPEFGLSGSLEVLQQ